MVETAKTGNTVAIFILTFKYTCYVRFVSSPRVVKSCKPSVLCSDKKLQYKKASERINKMNQNWNTRHLTRL